MVDSKAETGSRDGAPVVIKKYANRRLYNTAKSSYVTLEHLAAMVREGEDFVVRDAKTGDDITRAVLTQIIFEEEAKGKNMLPANFLRQLIRLYGDTLQGFVPGYLDATMDNFARNHEKLRDQVATTFGTNPAMAPFEALARTNLELFEKGLRMFPAYTASVQRTAPEDFPQEGQEEVPQAESESDLADLKAQIAAMQAQLNKLSDPD